MRNDADRKEVPRFWKNRAYRPGRPVVDRNPTRLRLAVSQRLPLPCNSMYQLKCVTQ